MFQICILLGFLSFIRRFFLFEAVCGKSPHSAQATGRAHTNSARGQTTALLRHVTLHSSGPLTYIGQYQTAAPHSDITAVVVIGLGIPQSCRFLIRLRCGIPPADSSIKGFACIPRPRPDRQTRPGLLPRQINCMPLPYYITACILQGLLSLFVSPCLRVANCCSRSSTPCRICIPTRIHILYSPHSYPVHSFL